MLNILTGLPKDRKKDFKTCVDFSQKTGLKIICGSSTMKTYCRILNIEPRITVSFRGGLAEAVYEIEGIDLAAEGAITLNECHKILLGSASSQNGRARELAAFLRNGAGINFTVGTADNGDGAAYSKNNILRRKEIVCAIASFLSPSHEVSVEYA